MFSRERVRALEDDEVPVCLPEDFVDGRDFSAAFSFNEEADAVVSFCCGFDDRDCSVGTPRGDDEDFGKRD